MKLVPYPKWSFLTMFLLLISSRPWLCYWIIHSIALMGDGVDDKLENDVVEFLNRCQVLDFFSLSLLFLFH